MRKALGVLILCAALVPTAAFATEPESGTAACGHLDEMEAAREALRAGDRELALELLKQARSLLVECEKSAPIASDPDPRVGRDLI